MKFLKQLMFTIVAVAALSLAVSAQRDDKKKPPPKNPDRPVVKPGEKPPPKDKDGDQKPKKPEMAFVLVVGGKDGKTA